MASQVRRLWIHCGSRGRLLSWGFDVVDWRTTTAKCAWYRSGCSFDACHSDRWLVHEGAGRGAPQPGTEVRGNLHFRKFISLDGASDRATDELWNESALGRSARCACNVSIYGPKGDSNPSRGRQT